MLLHIMWLPVKSQTNFSMFSFLCSLCHHVFSSSFNSMSWLWAAQCSTPCFMVNWLRTRMKSIFQMWNRQRFWQCWSKDSPLSEPYNIEHLLQLAPFCDLMIPQFQQIISSFAAISIWCMVEQISGTCLVLSLPDKLNDSFFPLSFSRICIY